MASILETLGLRRVDPVEAAKEWKRNINRESRRVERDIKAMDRAEKKALRECKKLAKDGHTNAARILAKEIVNTRRAKDRMYQARAQMNSVMMQLQTQLSMIKMQGCLQKSTEVMTAMNQLIKVPELQATMMSMAREMERAGLVEEMVTDAMETLDGEEVEDEANNEVDRVIMEITAGIMEPGGAVPVSGVRLPQSQRAPEQKESEAETAAAQAAAEQEEEEELKSMQARLAGL